MTHRSLVPWLIIGGVVLYCIAFYSVGMPSLSEATGKTFVRGQLLQYLVIPDVLFESWLGTPAEFSLADRLPLLLVAGGIFAWATALGWLLLKLCRLDQRLTRLETLVFAAAVGLNAVSTYILAIGLLGWLNRAALAAPAAITFGALLWFWRREKRGIRVEASTGSCSLFPADRGREQRRATRSQSRRRREKAEGVAQEQEGGILLFREKNRTSLFFLLLAAPFVAILLFGAMLPPVEFDVREYHLQAPKEFYLQGRIGFLPHNVYGNMPLGAEMLSLAAMIVAGDWWLGALAGKTVIASYAALTALGLLAAGRRFAGPTAGAVAAVVYISVPWVIQISALGLVDAALGCYLFLALYAVCLGSGVGHVSNVPLSHRHVGNVPHLILAGYLAGGAASCKYPGVLFVVIPLASWIPVGFRNAVLPWWRLAWKPALVFLLAATVGCGLWFAKNWALTGNPTYPLLYSVFDGKTWTPEKDRQWNRVHGPHDFSLWALGHDMGRIALTSDWLSPLLAPLAALGFFVWSKRRLAIALAAYFAIIVAAWWLLTHRIDRFWIPALPLAALLAGLGAGWSRERPWRIALVVLLIFGATANFIAASSVGGGYNRYFVSLARLRDDPERVDPWHRYLNRYAKDGKVLLVGDAQPFDLEMPALYNTCFDDSIFERLVKGRSPREVRAAFAGQGITHVYLDWSEVARYRRTYGFTDFVQPAVFDRLVAEGVLTPLPEIPDSSGRGYRVR